MRSGYNLIMEVTDVSKTVLQSNQVSYSKDRVLRGDKRDPSSWCGTGEMELGTSNTWIPLNSPDLWKSHTAPSLTSGHSGRVVRQRPYKTMFVFPRICLHLFPLTRFVN